MKQIILYQEWPAKDVVTYNNVYHKHPTKTVSVFPATMIGLTAAIKQAQRADALIISVNSKFTLADELMDYVTKAIRNKKYTKLFQPIQKVPT